MLTINKDILEYACDISHICDTLLMDSSYGNSDDRSKIVCEDKLPFVVNRLEKALHRVTDIFGDAYVPSSLYADKQGVCGFSVSIKDRVISDMLHTSESLDGMITSYIISYINNEWYELLGVKQRNEITADDLWRNANRLFSYKSSQSYAVKEV